MYVYFEYVTKQKLLIEHFEYVDDKLITVTLCISITASDCFC